MGWAPSLGTGVGEGNLGTSVQISRHGEGKSRSSSWGHLETSLCFSRSATQRQQSWLPSPENHSLFITDSAHLNM